MNVDLAFTAYNNLFRGQRCFLNPIPATAGNWTFKDNLFDKTAFEEYWEGPLDHDYNGYWPRTSGELATGQYAHLLVDFATPNVYTTNDKQLGSGPGYQTGPLGSYYLPASGPLFNGGSRTPGGAGLFHYTTRVDQTKEGGETGNVNIGLHYVATASSSSTQPKDSETPTGDGIPDYVEDANGNNDPNDITAGIETSPSLAETITGIADSLSTIYDDIDLDGDGMVGRIEKALGKQPLLSDNPLILTQATTGNEPEINTSELPLVNYNFLASIGRLNLFVDGADAALQGFDPAANGHSLLEWNTTYNSPGQHFMQARLTLTADTPDQGVNKAFGPIVSYSSENVVQFDDGFAQFDDNGAMLFAYLPDWNADYSIELKTPAGNHIKTIQNSTSSGVISESWNLLDENQNLFTGDEVEASFTVTLQNHAPQTRRQKLPKATVFVPNGDFDVAYAWHRDSEAQPFGQMWQFAQFGVVNSLMQPLGLYPVYPESFNRFTYDLYPGYPGYLPNMAKATDYLLPDLALPAMRNFYWHGHGSTASIGDGKEPDPSNPGAKVFITTKDVNEALGNTWSFWKLKMEHPYRLVFLDGCSTADTDDWRKAFGIRRYTAWMLKYPLADCIDFAADRDSIDPITNEHLNLPLPVTKNMDLWEQAQLIAGAENWKTKLKVFGYPGITIDGYLNGYW